MAASGYTPIQLYRTSTSGAAPVAGNLSAGELAINYNTADMSVWALNTGGSVVRLMNNPAGLKYPTVDGTANYVLKTDGAGTLSWTSAVTSVTGTAPVVSSGGTTPAISMAAATGSVNGYLSSTDWTAFNGKLSTTGGTMTGLLTTKELALTKTAPSISAGVLTLDCSLSNTFAVSLNAAITSFTVSNIPTSGSYYEFNLEFTADGTARSVTWTFSSVAVKWPGGTAPTLTSTNGKKDTFVFYTYDAGTTWLGFVAGQNL
jgi:hypothetical protein